jgi:hypothetical protein
MHDESRSSFGNEAKFKYLGMAVTSQNYIHESVKGRLNPRPTQPPIQWVPKALFLGVKRPEREADHSPPYNAEVKNE